MYFPIIARFSAYSSVGVGVVVALRFVTGVRVIVSSVVTAMRVVVRRGVSGVLVFMLVFVDVLMAVFVGMLVGVCLTAVVVLVLMPVLMFMSMNVRVFVIAFHRVASSFMKSAFLPLPSNSKSRIAHADCQMVATVIQHGSIIRTRFSPNTAL